MVHPGILDLLLSCRKQERFFVFQQGSDGWRVSASGLLASGAVILPGSCSTQTIELQKD